MRKITVDFSLQTYPLFAGYVGEHNATELTAIKPADLEGVTYSLAFMTNGEIIHSKFFGVDEEIKVTLWQQLTQDNGLFVQLEAYDENGKYLGKSGMVKLVLSNSVHGMDMIADADNPDVYSEIAQNSVFREKLECIADTLNILSTSEKGELLFDGEKIGGQVLASDVFYENLDLLDQTNTVEAALNETIDFIFQKLPEIYVEEKEIDSIVDDALTDAKESGDFNGKDGKSAYQYAVEGGFKGTEEEFNSLLANIGNLNTRTTATKEFTFGDKISVELVGGSDYIGYFYEEDADIPIGTEIANVELCILDDYWVSIKNTINQVSVDDDTGYIAFARVFPATSDALIPTQLLGVGITSARITYYTD